MIKNKNFKLIEQKKLKELQVDYYFWEHRHLKTKIIYLKNNNISTDNENFFAITFKTPAENNSGQAHILEHSVLSGSKNFPFQGKKITSFLRESGLVNSCNAMTGDDFTTYFFANNGQLANFKLASDIFLDAVFNPTFLENENIFKQEGWRINPLTKKYEGVVLEEMQGHNRQDNVFLYQNNKQTLFPELSYKFNNGGEPKEIIKLDWIKTKKYYQKYYHPSNATIYIFGRQNLNKFLNDLEKKYLSNYQYKNFSALEKNIKLAPRKAVKKINSFLPENTLSLSFYLPQQNLKDKITANILNAYLLDNEDSILNQALVKNNLCQRVFVSNHLNLKYSFLTFNFQAFNSKDLTKIKKIFYTEINKIIKEGLDQEKIKNILNTWEQNFLFREFNTRRGYNLLGSFILPFFILGQKKEFLQLKILKEFKKDLNYKYFEKWLKKNILNNQRAAETFFQPDKKINYKKELEKQFKNKWQQANQKQKEKWQIEIKNFQQWQNKIIIPQNLKVKLNLKFKPILKFSTKILKNKEKYLHLKIKNKKIKVIELSFDLSFLSAEDLYYLPTLLNFLNNPKSKKLSSENFLNWERKIFNSAFFNLKIYQGKNKKNNPRLNFYASYLQKNQNQVEKYLKNIFQELIFEEEKIIRDAQKYLLQIKSTMSNNAYSYLKIYLESQSSPAGELKNILFGFGQYNFVKNNILKDKAEITAQKINKIYQKIFNRQNLAIAEISAHSDFSWVDKINLKKEERKKINFNNQNKKENLAIVFSDFSVYYNLIFWTAKFNWLEIGRIKVVFKYLQEILNKKIREEGSAYGAYVLFDNFGKISCLSYRDGEVAQTFKIYQQIPIFLTNKISEKKIKELQVGIVNNYNSSKNILYYTNEMLSQTLSEINQINLTKIKDGILKTKPADFKKIAKKWKKMKKKIIFASVGPEQKIKEAKKYFDRIEKDIL